MRDRLPPIPTHGPPSPVKPTHPAPTHDQSLDPWAHFTYELVSNFGPHLAFGGYDAATHKYHPAYINPKKYDLFVSAAIGLANGRHLALPHPAPVRRDPTRAADMLRVRDHRGAEAAMAAAVARLPVGHGGLPGTHGGPGEIGPGGGDGGGPLVPNEVHSFEWILVGEGGFTSRKVVTRPISPMEIAHLDLPVVGQFTLTLQLVFTNNTYGERSVTFLARDFFIVGLGDSSASGEGNPDFQGNTSLGGDALCEGVTTLAAAKNIDPPMSNEPIWVEPKAHRSTTSGQTLAALSLQHNAADTMHPAGGRTTLDKITYATFARSGAGITAGLINTQDKPQDDYIGVGQVQEAQRAAAGRQIDAVLINIGGNDAGFSGVLTDLLTGDNVFTANDGNGSAAVKARLDALLGVGLAPGQAGQIEVSYDNLKNQIDTRLKPRNVYITGYPTGLFDTLDAQGRVVFRSCGVFRAAGFLDINSSDNDLIKKYGTLLNALIKRKAQQFGWHFVEVAPDFVGRGYCSADPLWIAAEDSCKHQGDFDGMMHPTERGHALWALRYVAALRANTVKPPGHGPVQPGRVGGPGEIAR